MQDPTKLIVAYRRLQGRRWAEGEVLGVFCARRAEVMDVRACQTCSHYRGLCVDAGDTDTFLRCAWTSPADARSAGGGATGAGRAVPLSEVMTFPAVCVQPSLPLSDLVGILLRGGLSAVPVVDESGRAVGLVSKTDVLRWRAEAHEGPQAGTVRDVMTHVVFALHAEASITRAAALMAFEGVHRLVVVSADGRALGVVSALDILRWLASEDGYVVPRGTPGRTPKDGEQPS